MKPRPACASQNGLSLLEALIAVVLISMAATLLAVSSRTSVAGQLRSKVYGNAATATQEALEVIQLLSLDSVSRLDLTPMEHTQGAAVEVYASVRRIRPADVDQFNSLDTSTLRYVTLSTRFRSNAGATVSKDFTTIVYKP